MIRGSLALGNRGMGITATARHVAQSPRHVAPDIEANDCTVPRAAGRRRMPDPIVKSLVSCA